MYIYYVHYVIDILDVPGEYNFILNAVILCFSYQSFLHTACSDYHKHCFGANGIDHLCSLQEHLMIFDRLKPRHHSDDNILGKNPKSFPKCILFCTVNFFKRKNPVINKSELILLYPVRFQISAHSLRNSYNAVAE